MKKPLMIATMLTTLSVSGDASALDTGKIRKMWSSGLPVQNLLAESLIFMAVGRVGDYCLYLTQWESPFNPNDVLLCVLRELRSAVYPSCIINSMKDIVAFVSAGPGAMGGQTYCGGFDTLGVPYTGVTLLAGEIWLTPVLVGNAIFPTAVPIVHAIEVA